jgi:hypothetical protein
MSTMARPLAHIYLPAAPSSVVPCLSLPACGSRRCPSLCAGQCALRELQYLFLDYFERLYPIWRDLNMTDIMLDQGGSMMSLIAPAIEVIRGILYSRRVFHPLSLAIRGVPFPPVLLPARWNRLCRAVITLIDNRNGPALSAQEFLPGKFFFACILHYYSLLLLVLYNLRGPVM